MRKIILLLILFFSGQSFATTDTIIVNKTGRNIQVDGLLIEWSSKTVQKAAAAFIDIINTPDGISGYIRYSSYDSLPLLKIIISDIIGNILLDIDNDNISNENYSVAISDGMRDRKNIVTEWHIPQNKISVTNNKYSFYIYLSNETKSVQDSIVIIGKVINDNQDNSNYFIQLIIKTLLLVLLLFLFLQIKKHGKRKK